VQRLVPVVATVSQSCGDAQICRRMVDDNRDDEQAVRWLQQLTSTGPASEVEAVTEPLDLQAVATEHPQLDRSREVTVVAYSRQQKKNAPGVVAISRSSAR
jgi:hypothetical protein